MRVPAGTEKQASLVQKPAPTSAGTKAQSRASGGGEGSPAPSESKPVGRRSDGDHAAAFEVTGARAAAEAHPAAGGQAGAGSAGPASKGADEAHPGLPIPIASFTI